MFLTELKVLICPAVSDEEKRFRMQTGPQPKLLIKAIDIYALHWGVMAGLNYNLRELVMDKHSGLFWNANQKLKGIDKPPI